MMNIKEALENALVFTISSISLVFVVIFAIVFYTLPYILIIGGSVAVVLYILQFFGVI